LGPGRRAEVAVEKLLTVDEVAELLRIKPSTAYTWVREGKFPHKEFGRLV
jgi:excisionase family DNA binding protein